MTQLTRNCDTCHKSYTYTRSTSKYCSAKCRTRASTNVTRRRRLPSDLRYSILTRDSYTCQYCGASPRKDPDVTLHVDHIKPVSRGGTDNSDNLITSCDQCNQGKHDG